MSSLSLNRDLASSTISSQHPHRVMNLPRPQQSRVRASSASSSTSISSTEDREAAPAAAVPGSTTPASASTAHFYQEGRRMRPLNTSNLLEHQQRHHHSANPDLESSRGLLYGNKEVYWQRGIIRRTPMLGLASLVGVLVCIALSILIPIKARNTSFNSWKVSPSVLLAIISAVSNSLLGFAFATGMAISWWRKALHGTTLRQLYHHSKRSTNLVTALMSLEFGSPMVLAAIFTAAAMFDGPLLQRSLLINITASKATALTTPTATYDIDWRYLIAASSLTLAAFLSVSASLYGWWELSREVSLNPLDTGKALGSPILKTSYVSSHAPLSDLLMDIGHTEVKYGEACHEIESPSWVGKGVRMGFSTDHKGHAGCQSCGGVARTGPAAAMNRGPPSYTYFQDTPISATAASPVLRLRTSPVSGKVMLTRI